jgi:hypothetical protein
MKQSSGQDIVNNFKKEVEDLGLDKHSQTALKKISLIFDNFKKGVDREQLIAPLLTSFGLSCCIFHSNDLPNSNNCLNELRLNKKLLELSQQGAGSLNSEDHQYTLLFLLLTEKEDAFYPKKMSSRVEAFFNHLVKYEYELLGKKAPEYNIKDVQANIELSQEDKESSVRISTEGTQLRERVPGSGMFAGQNQGQAKDEGKNEEKDEEPQPFKDFCNIL